MSGVKMALSSYSLRHHFTRSILLIICACVVTINIHARCSAAAPNSLCMLQALDYEPGDLHSESRLAALFDAWSHKHGKEYPVREEKERRFQVFKENLQYIHEHNSKGQSSFTLGLTRFADITNDEFKASSFFGAGPRDVISEPRADLDHRHGMMGRLNESDPPALGSCDTRGLPLALDWREKGVVTGVKDQGRCGSCWAFAAAGAIESAHAIETGSLIGLSEQQLVSCDTTNFGCIGGWMDWAYGWVANVNGGISSEADYPYTSGDSGIPFQCQFREIAVSIDTYVRLPSNDESALICAVAEQPVSVALHASGLDFQFYTGGVFDADCPTDVDHAVLIVGWGVSNGQEYWIAKNSWGPWWGCEGYIYLAKGTHLPEGICGLHFRSSFPVVPSSTTQCADGIACLAKQTCCCTSEVESSCERWGCCPEGYPICNGGFCYQDTLSLHPLPHDALKRQKPAIAYNDPQFFPYKHAFE